MNILNLRFSIKKGSLDKISEWESRMPLLLLGILAILSIVCFYIFYDNGLGLSYNDARSHLDIGRRVVEGLKPGLAQLGSVWLPLPHLLMIPTIWHDFMWHTGLSGALPSMLSFVATSLLIYFFLQKLGVGLSGKILGVAVFVANLNVLYLQSTAMTELLLLATMTAGMYELLKWSMDENFLNLIKSAFWIMLSSLVRYEGWFLLLYAAFLIIFIMVRKKGYKVTEGTLILFGTLAGVGILLWFLWNTLIFNDPLYFAYGPFSARTQQKQMELAGVLSTKNNLLLSLKVYLFALIYNSYAYNAVLGLIGAIVFFTDKNIKPHVRFAATVLLTPLIFNVLALFMGHSVLFIQGISGDTWFNVRYGLMMLPSIAIFAGYLVHKAKSLRVTIIGLFVFVIFFAFTNGDAVTIDDARVGSSQKNVSEVSGYLNTHAKNTKGFVLISAASHDAIIFSSGLPMKRFIHEGTGGYWESATGSPDRWARWIVVRTNDNNDLTWKSLSEAPDSISKYKLAAKYPFADVYELKKEYLAELITEPILGKQK
ncbi:MAG: family 2 glycosyl transferase [Candidatus Gottesmanbacteria bacterium GW2011_GWA2_43_14]|uniref:Family 2 glycosyl transferase n=1 Tax=Candidatus Gottesmanbacteria bacterium GW2011_GWA2_43_14 TaxID=1618443 RepID=A0A0G1FSZ0_9BACT|nr:MAG: family 2 glycosyl transferase [Candidatus Gottesmanbacteria bacterium GW2011_GWA2_43_14]